MTTGSTSVYRQSATVFSLNWALLAMNFVTGVLVARVVGPEGKGILFLLMGLQGILGSLFGLGLPTAAVYFFKKDERSLQQIMASCFLLAILSAGVASLFFFVAADRFIDLFLGSSRTIAVEPAWIWLTMGSFFLGLVSGPVDGLLVADGNMKLYAVKNMAGGFLGIGLIWFFTLWLDWGVTGVLVSQLAAALIPVGMLSVWMSGKGAGFGIRPAGENLRGMLRVGLQQYGIGLVAMVTKRFDAFIIAGLLTIRDAGYYSIAYGLFDLVLSIPRATVLPLISKIAGKEEDRSAHYYRISRLQFTLMLMLLLCFAPFVPSFIRLVYGEEFLPAQGAVWMIFPAVVGANLCVITGAYLSGLGRPGRGIVPSLIGSALQVAVSLMLVPRVGVLGSSLALGLNYLAAISLLFAVSLRGELRLKDMLVMSREDRGIVRDFLAGQRSRFQSWR